MNTSHRMTLTNTYVHLNSYCPCARRKRLMCLWVGTHHRFSYIFLLFRGVGRSRTFNPNANTISQCRHNTPCVSSCGKKTPPYHQQLKTYRQSCSHLGPGSDEVTYWMSNAPSLSGVSCSSLNVVARVLGGTGCT